MSFKDIRGQDSAIEFLRNSILNDKVSHAYIFTGPSGVGKKMAALNFAKALNCLDGKDGVSCDACSQCKKIDAGNHPDVMVLSPVKEDSGLGIDRIRSLTRDAGLRPYEGRRKVYILEDADFMTPQAENALLKTLEEPPSESVLILIAENIDSLFSTIRSRAKKVKFLPLAAEEVKKILTAKYKVDEDKADILARLSSGELDKALKYNEEGFLDKRARIIDALRSGALLDAETDGLSKGELRSVLDVALAWYRDMLIAKTPAGSRTAFFNADMAGQVRDEARRASFEWLEEMINQVVLTGSLLDQNVNPKLAMGVLGIKAAGRKECTK